MLPLRVSTFKGGKSKEKKLYNAFQSKMLVLKSGQGVENRKMSKPNEFVTCLMIHGT
jgi:hypothetical protein